MRTSTEFRNKAIMTALAVGALLAGAFNVATGSEGPTNNFVCMRELTGGELDEIVTDMRKQHMPEPTSEKAICVLEGQTKLTAHFYKRGDFVPSGRDYDAYPVYAQLALEAKFLTPYRVINGEPGKAQLHSLYALRGFNTDGDVIRPFGTGVNGWQCVQNSKVFETQVDNIQLGSGVRQPIEDVFTQVPPSYRPTNFLLVLGDLSATTTFQDVQHFRNTKYTSKGDVHVTATNTTPGK